MAEVYLNVEWGEMPFSAEGRPAPLLRPEPLLAGRIPGIEPVGIPDDLRSATRQPNGSSSPYKLNFR